MPVSVVVGGQYGSEGKGKITKYFAEKFNAAAVVRVGGGNSGHTVYSKDKKFVLKALPVSAVMPNTLSILPSGSYINVDTLLGEIKRFNIKPEQLAVDQHAVIVPQDFKVIECNNGLVQLIGSTGSGTGQAVLNRISRLEPVTFAYEVPELEPYLAHTKSLIRKMLDEEKHIIIEGTQGFGLSPYHVDTYPFCTSRDTTAAGFVMEAGLSPLDVKNVIMVLRTYPIRVGGNSGPLANEITWEDVSCDAATTKNLTEFTSVTHRVRRVGRFDPELVKQAIEVNNPNIIILNHFDYCRYDWHGSDVMTNIMRKKLSEFEHMIGRRIDYVGTDGHTLIKA